MKENEVPWGEHEKGQKVSQNEKQVTKKRVNANPGMGTGQKEQPEKISTRSGGKERK